MLAAAPLADAIGPVCWNRIVAAPGPGFPSVIPFALLFNVTPFSGEPARPASATVVGQGDFGRPCSLNLVSGASMQVGQQAVMMLTIAPVT
jgi:hypothetical protein